MTAASRKTLREAPPPHTPQKTLRTVPCTTRECPKRRPCRRKNASGGSPAAARQHAKSVAQRAAQRLPSAQRAPNTRILLSVQCCAHHLRSTCHLHRARYRDDRASGRAEPRCMRHLHGARHTVRNTITMMQAKPIRSVGANTVPSINALVTVAETGSTVPIRLARTLPMSLTPCI